MLKYVSIFIFVIFGNSVNAQTDSLFVGRHNSNWGVKYTVKTGETKPMLSKRFYLPDGALDTYNEWDDSKKFTSGDFMYVPVLPSNYFVVKPPPIDLVNYRELYYRVAEHDDITTIATYSGITKSTMRTWNNLRGNSLAPGQVLFIGWLRVMPKDTSNPFYGDAYYVPKKKPGHDSAKVTILGGLDTVYTRQTNNGLNVLTEKGTAVFFDKPGKVTVYYAFHNSTPRGSIIKVFNPGTSKTVYVKVIGPLPNTKLYANSIIGISSAAKEALGVTDNKAWCELSYSTN